MPILEASTPQGRLAHAVPGNRSDKGLLPDTEALQGSGSFSIVLFNDDDHREFCVRMSHYFISSRPKESKQVRQHRVMQLQFVVKGDLHFQLSRTGKQLLSEGQYTLYDLPSIRQISWFNPANSHTTTLDIYFTPRYLKRQGAMPKILTPGSITPEMKGIIQSIIDCNYAGELRKMYLHCKVTELLVLALKRIELGPAEGEAIHLKQYDVEKLRESREYLMQHMEDPPTVKELAHKVGINDFKLKKGYKQLFGTTIFGDFQHARMEKARDFLFDGRKSIMEIALLCGYRDASNFSRAFKDYYGVPPGQVQKAAEGPFIKHA